MYIHFLTVHIYTLFMTTLTEFSCSIYIHFLTVSTYFSDGNILQCLHTFSGSIKFLLWQHLLPFSTILSHGNYSIRMQRLFSGYSNGRFCTHFVPGPFVGRGAMSPRISGRPFPSPLVHWAPIWGPFQVLGWGRAGEGGSYLQNPRLNLNNPLPYPERNKYI
jgi:hypothetical protein